jgi:polysaccharide biosynthesis PFTS motif protein
VAILARDYAQFNVMKFVGNANAIEALIYTNSNYTVQPLWVRVCKRSYRTHMVWYSQNCFPFIYKDDSTTSYLPGYKHMAIDQHWVWTEGFQRYLKIGANQQSDIKIIGPVTWYLPNQVEENMTNSIKLVIFDVTPFKEEVIKKVGLYDNYYSAETVKKFINDIIYVTDEISNKKDGLKIELFLKHKRGRMDGHDVEYLQLVDRLDLDKRIKILPSNSNIYSLLSACDLSIAIPYTSTAYVSSSINKPTIYFDSTGLLLPSYEKNELISFAGNTRELEARIMGVLGLDAF